MDVPTGEAQKIKNNFEECESQLSEFLIRDFGDINPFRRRFRELRTNAEKVDLTYQQMAQYGLLDNLFREDRKNDQGAKRHKKKGDNGFAKGEIIHALGHFTRCIMQAESKELLGMAYANRSASLFRLHMYTESIADIDRAIDHSYPQRQRPSLIARRNRAEELTKKNPSPKDHEELPCIPPEERNPDIPHATASNKIRIRKDVIQRDVVVASKDIEIGEVVAIENPIGYQLSSGKSEVYHCHYCLKICYNPIPCQTCTQALYCGDQCREEASLKYHNNECPILRSVRQWVGLRKPLLLGLKMMFLSEDPSFREECFQYVHPLEQFLNKPSIDTDMYLLSVAASGMFYLVNEHTKLFSQENIEEQRQQFKGILLKQLRICNLLAGAITEVVPVFSEMPENPLEVIDMVRQNIASGMFPFYVNFKHSCTPNVAVNHYGTTKVIRAIRTIKQGNQLYISYGPHYYYNLKAIRQDHLQKWFHFRCACRACIGDYPLMSVQIYTEAGQNLSASIVDVRRGSFQAALNGIPRFIEEIYNNQRQEISLALFFFTSALTLSYDLLGNRSRIP